MSDLSKITQLKKQLDGKRPLDPKKVQALKEDFFIRSTYHSNAIEGNTLTIYETKAILEDGITIGKGKTMREHLEAINHHQAITFIEDLLPNRLTEKIVRDIHQIIMLHIDRTAGSYRQEDVLITGANHSVTPFLQIPEEMEELMRWLYSEQANHLHPVERAAILHSKFVNIHPFLDGNGRAGRLIMNFELIRSGYLPIIIYVEDRIDYYEALDIAATQGDYKKLLKMVSNQEKVALEQYLDFLA